MLKLWGQRNVRPHRAAWVVALVLVLMTAACGGRHSASTTAGGSTPSEGSQPTSGGLYTVRWRSDGGSIPLNTLHTWTVHVDSAGGVPVADAQLNVDGGMPAHNHGMPSRPEVTANLGGGDYRVEGMQFQMPGAWVITVSVAGPAGNDVVAFPLFIAP